MKKAQGMTIILLITLSQIMLVDGASDPIPDTDEFNDPDCRDAKQRLLDLVHYLKNMGWTFFVFGFNPSDGAIFFVFAVVDYAIGDHGEYRSGRANFDQCNDGEFDGPFTYLWDTKTNSWIKRDNPSDPDNTMNILVIVAGIALAIIVIGLLYIYISSGGFVGGGGGGDCNIAKPIPTYNLCGG